MKYVFTFAKARKPIVTSQSRRPKNWRCTRYEKGTTNKSNKFQSLQSYSENQASIPNNLIT